MKLLSVVCGTGQRSGEMMPDSVGCCRGHVRSLLGEKSNRCIQIRSVACLDDSIVCMRFI